MKGTILRTFFSVSVCVLLINCNSAEQSSNINLSQRKDRGIQGLTANGSYVSTNAPVMGRSLFSITPNQGAANSWYKLPEPNTGEVKVVNGHLDESFGDPTRWPLLLKNLKAANGTFNLFASEIGHLSAGSGFLKVAAENQLPLSVEVPGFTQCADGAALAEAELYGRPIPSGNFFCTHLGLCSPTDRKDPSGAGWFVTRDNIPIVPNEIIFDERMPNLLPSFDAGILAQTTGSWSDRKSQAKTDRTCAQTLNPTQPRLEGLQDDYIEYLSAARQKWSDRMPRVSLHWNVNPGWEWHDEMCLDKIYQQNPSFFLDKNNLWLLKSPCHNSVEYLKQLILRVRNAGFNVHSVMMDVDWTYDTAYVVENLKRLKAMLSGLGVQLGINVVIAFDKNGPCPTPDCEVFLNGKTLSTRKTAGISTNELYERSLLQITKLLQQEGILDGSVQLRVGSWSERPSETGARVSESIPGSMAHTANKIFSVFVSKSESFPAMNSGTTQGTSNIASSTSGSAGTVTSTPPVEEIIGNIDGVFNGQQIQGWACQKSLSQSILVHVYLGGSAGIGVFAGEFSANLTSDSGVSALCGTSGIAHRFVIPISTMSAHAGKSIFIHGISPTGLENKAITRSGSFQIPTPTVAVATVSAPLQQGGDVIGDIDGVFNGQQIQGWACQKSLSQSILVHVYLGGAAGVGVFAGEFRANLYTDAGVSAVCRTSGVPHRFVIPISGTSAQSGKLIYIHGISPTGGENKLTTRSGVFRIP
ncbi:MAG: hypothetical protein RIR26_2832 [Pseudomonadota bacterium]